MVVMINVDAFFLTLSDGLIWTFGRPRKHFCSKNICIYIYMYIYIHIYTYLYICKATDTAFGGVLKISVWSNLRKVCCKERFVNMIQSMV